VERPVKGRVCQSDLSSLLTVVIRCAGERTETLCVNTVKVQAQGAEVLLVREAPFATALHRSMELAIERGRRWSLLMDADVLLASWAFESLVDELSGMGRPFYMLNGLVLDRMFLAPAHAGVHAYETRHLVRALDFMEAAREDQRPESRLSSEMARLGVPTVRSRLVLGLHDFEQYYRDLYRKAFVRSFKFRLALKRLCERVQTEHSDNPENQAMFRGLCDGMAAAQSQSCASLDAGAYLAAGAVALQSLGLSEKTELRAGTCPADAAIAEYKPDEWCRVNAHWLAPEGFALSPRDSA
jgi:hypothetical protein